jgi:hypothetical protein
MALINILRQLWRRRDFVALALACACLLGVAIAYRVGFPPSLTSRQYQVGIASASALIDSSRSQVADLGVDTGSDVGTLSARASLLGSVMTSAPIVNQIARDVGIASDQLIATPPVVVGAPPSLASSVSDASARASSRNANILNVSIVAGGQLPIIEVDTQAPTAARAARLANASFAALQAEVNSTATTQHVPVRQRIIIRSLGPAGSATVNRGVGALYGLIGGLVLFVLACCAILGIPAFRNAWRRASALDELGSLDAAILHVISEAEVTNSASNDPRNGHHGDEDVALEELDGTGEHGAAEPRQRGEFDPEEWETAQGDADEVSEEEFGVHQGHSKSLAAEPVVYANTFAQGLLAARRAPRSEASDRSPFASP